MSDEPCQSTDWRAPEPQPSGLMTLRGALLYHYYEDPLCRRIMSLLQCVADSLRAMHADGVAHGALNNRQILVCRKGSDSWERAWILDAPAPMPSGEVPALKRMQDLASLRLPSDLMRVLISMYFAPEPVPEWFQKEWKRRPKPDLKAMEREEKEEPRAYPTERDIWIWDDRSMQAIPALRSRDKRKYYRKRDLLTMGMTLAKRGGAIRREMKKLEQEAWSHPVEMKHRIGLSCNLEPHRFEQERRWLDPLGPLSLLVRLYHHESPTAQRYALEAVRKLHAEGHRVTVALVQDRNAILYPRKWAEFVDKAGGALTGFVEGFEVGHAINRVKWGIWSYKEYAGLLAPFANWSDRYPQIPLMGPGGIDFEFPRILPFLEQMPEGMKWSAYSHHMYVDRRGAPENEQSGYTTVDKLRMARAVARVHPQCEDRVVVSEVNWPLVGTGVWSPVGSPYETLGPRSNDPSVDEESYAAFMQRYYLLALCSGMADRVYWWNLAAHGFGLIDDRDPGGWRPRPAYHAFKHMVDHLRDATFVRREGEGPDAHYHFESGKGAFVYPHFSAGDPTGSDDPS